MPPGRPREFDIDAALDRAMDLFWTKGYRETTTRDLETALDVAPSSLYRAFGSKAELFDAALARYQDLIDRKLLGPLRDSDDGVPSLDRFFADLGEWLVGGDARGCLIGRMMSDRGHPAPQVEERLAHYRRTLRTVLRRALRRAADAGEIPIGTVNDRAELLTGMVLGLNLAVQAGYSRKAQRDLVRGVRAELARWRADGAVVASLA